MTEALELSDGDRVLEMDTGSGYQAAFFPSWLLWAELSLMERIPALTHKARGLLRELGYHNVAGKQA